MEQGQLIKQCGKLCVLDRLLVKLSATGHRVLLFTTMTKLLDLLEHYLAWRRTQPGPYSAKLQHLRIDGSTSLEDRCVLHGAASVRWVCHFPVG